MSTNEYESIMNLAIMLVNTVKTTREQEAKYLANPRCKRPTFSGAQYALGRLAAREGLPEPTLEEVEKLIRMSW